MLREVCNVDVRAASDREESYLHVLALPPVDARASSAIWWRRSGDALDVTNLELPFALEFRL